MGKSHDPREFIRGIQQILINNTIRIGFLFGAGTSMAAPLTDKDGKDVLDDKNKLTPLIPGVGSMTEKIMDSISDENFKKALEIIKKELEDSEKDKNKKDIAFRLENIISSLDQKIKVIGKDTLCGLKKDQLKELRSFFKKEIKSLVAVHENIDINIESSSRLHSDFARWIRYAARKNEIEVFTTKL